MRTNGLKSLSILLVILTGGCNSQSPSSEKGGKPKASTTVQAPAKVEAHTHGSGPHGGTIADWGGGKFHVEFTVDHDKKESTVYILGGDAKTPAPIKADKLLLNINDPQFQLDLAAKPLDGEADGLSSRFVGTHDSLGKVQEFAGTISGEVDGKPYAGDFKEVP